jgi:nicotinamidase-related amidase
MSSAAVPSILLVVDMLSDYAFPDAEHVIPAAEAAVPAMLRAREGADELGVRVVYANDIHDDWHCSPERAVAHALEGRRPDLVRPLVPREGDAFLHKGQHSAFYGTPLAHLLHETAVQEVVICGQVTEQCVLYTALDAYVRDYEVTIVRDGVAALDDELGAAALRMMERNMSARLVSADEWRSGATADRRA